MSRRNRVLQMLMDSSSSSSDDERIVASAYLAQVEYEQMNAPSYGGSVPGHRVINRGREAGHARLYEDYFSEAPTYGPTIFRRRLDISPYVLVHHYSSSFFLIRTFSHRFRMSRSLFFRIVNAVEEHDRYFVQKRNRAGILGLSPLQKITAAFRMLTYGVAADATDDYVRIGESTAIESLKKFVKAVVEVFGDEYLRSPTDYDTARLLAIGEERGFPGMLGSIDCMHWKWKNCPTAWQGMYTGHVHEPTIILEAVASQDLWIWHAFFGLPGSHNDINVLHRSPLFAKLAEGQAPEINYTINGHNYTMGYYLTDGIYPPWATFVKVESMNIDQRVEWMKENSKETYEEAKECMRTNYYGAKLVTEALLPLLQLSSSGRIVNVSSGFGLLRNFNNEELKKEFNDIDNLTEKRLDELLDLFLEDFKANLIEAHGWPTGGSSAYKVAKAALNAYTRILAKKYTTMRINCLTPGYVKSDMSMHMGVLTPEEGASNPVKVALLPDDGPTGAYFDRDGEASFV